jgi:hypothetical protein
MVNSLLESIRAPERLYLLGEGPTAQAWLLKPEQADIIRMAAPEATLRLPGPVMPPVGAMPALTTTPPLVTTSAAPVSAASPLMTPPPLASGAATASVDVMESPNPPGAPSLLDPPAANADGALSSVGLANQAAPTEPPH